MRKLKLVLLATVLALAVVSCSRDITEPTMSANPSKPAVGDVSLTASFTVANADSLLRFSWSAADFGFTASVTYNVQIASKSDFSDAKDLFSTQSLKGTAKVGDVNAILLAWNYNVGTNVTVYYRVGATVSTSLTAVYSDAKSKSLTAYDAVINYPMIYVPGAYQGWSPGANNGRLYSYNFNSVYQGILRVKDGANANTEFKVTINPNWNGPNYGGSLTKTGNNYAGALDPAGNNFSVSSAVYSFTVDVNAKTIAMNKTDDWGIIGDATPTGWNSDTDMFYNGQRKMWEITLNLTAATIKFRANDDWSLNYGSNANDGKLNAGGSNIPIPAAGNYTIRFDPVKLTYTVIKN
jgi:hypothetical protein